MHVPLEALPLMMLVIFAGYVVFGMTGFGASPITIPVLAHFLPLPFVLALCSVLDLAAALLSATTPAGMPTAGSCWRSSRSPWRVSPWGSPCW